MSRSQHIIKQEHHPLMSSETRIFFLGLDFFFWHSCLFFQNSSFCGSANQRRANGKFATVLRRTEADQICALGLFRNSLFQPDSVSVGVCRSFRGVVWRVGDVCEVFRRREEEDPVSAAAGGWCPGQSAVSADAAGQWTRPAGESEETTIPSILTLLFLSLLLLSAAFRAFRSSLNRNGGDRGWLSHFRAGVPNPVPGDRLSCKV